ncbi:MAG TPA: MBOAT family protein [Stellaceae bacterium]|jgi:D-alanyl-lipoteichoic acid acyltransferase DltB (MBOAT superfamily)|nr:MBOAT family protein [Stellaceae bacterium]
MLFPTSGFLLFFLVVAATMAALQTRFTAKKAVLVIASYYFYAQWDWRFCFLLGFSTALSYGAGRLIEAVADRERQRLVLGAAVALHLGLLGTFKYLDFFVLSANSLAHLLGLEHELPFVEILLPVGISFFTFHGISYLTDVYRGDVAVCRNPLDMALYMSFFPQLVAGPIVRAAYFLPQLARPSSEPIPIAPALLLILGGLFKKVVIANYLATELVDPVFGAPTSYGGPDLLLGVYAYAVQIYCDFSAYSDMAIALAALLGFRFPANFNQPYRSQRLREFWQRWHISLSSWLRDYLYKPLGGNRRGRLVTYRNLIVTMLLGGIWHGAGWKFVAWGALHGGGLAVERLLEPLIGRRAGSPAAKTIATLVVFHFVCLAWIFFRAEDFEVARLYIAGFGAGWGEPLQQAKPFTVALIALGLASQFTPPGLFERITGILARAPAWGLGAVAGVVVAAINALGPEGVAPFIYFRF